MGKQKISITIDENLSKNIERMLKDGKFRNRSHVLEFSLRKFLEDTEDGN
jgi:Arc/MetJ-type ribon-helix-helix transcriptional regulator